MMIRFTLRRPWAFALSLLIILSPICLAQETATLPAPSVKTADLHQALLDLTNPWTVMCVAAHPDDEDGTTLTVLRRKYGVHTVSLFSTFGEGGQNAVGPELYEQLGVIRARETIKASQIQGSEPHFLGLKDFGFSKSSEETFRVWGHDEALRRMVLKLRELRPDVVITNHDTSRGHGHHQATGQLILEAFAAAADPQRFPEQLTKFKPWQVQRLFVRIFGPGNPNEKAATVERIVSIDPNEVDPIRGTSFAEQALAALQQHATQGPWPKTIEELLKARASTTGKLALIRYQLVREAPKAPPLPPNAATVIDGLKPSAAVASKLKLPAVDGEALTASLEEPDKILDTLTTWRVQEGAVTTPPANDDAHRLALLENRLNNALAVAAGISVLMTPGDPALIPGQQTPVTVNLSNAGNRIPTIKKLSVESWGKEVLIDMPEQMLPDTETGDTIEINTPTSTPLTVPKDEHLYDETFLGLPFRARAELALDGARFQTGTTLYLDVRPAVEITDISPSPCVRTEEALGNCRSFSIAVTNHLDNAFRGTIRINEGTGPAHTEHLVLGPGESRQENVAVTNVIGSTVDQNQLRKSSVVEIAIYANNATQPMTQRTLPVIYSNARVKPDLRVGYIPSFDQTIERALASLGVEAKSLSVEDVQNADLSTYSTIIIDNRGYEAHPELMGANSRLLQFTEQGGTLIVFYHKSNEWNPDPKKNRPQLAPYPLTLGDERVTDETAPVMFLQPLHPLLVVPNRIRQTDFKGWIQERGLYYPKEWDKRYAALFAMSDKGETPLRGGLLVAKYGKGNYIYTSMVWYRQLRAGVPGAYRMFANMISYGR